MPGGEIDAIAKAFPHIRARDARAALRELPELRASGLGEERLGLLFRLAERLDGLPRHVAMHPCGVLLSDATLLDRTPVEASFAGFPDEPVRQGRRGGPRPAQARRARHPHAVGDGPRGRRDPPGRRGRDRPRRRGPGALRRPADLRADQLRSRTLGCFQIESPGQRELVGKSGLDSFADVITDISLFRPGPVKSDMITPYLEAKQGWRMPTYLHDDLRPILRETRGVVVFHEQVIEIIALFTGCTLAAGRRGPPRAGRRRRHGPDEALVPARGRWGGATPGTWSTPSGRCCEAFGVVRVLQGPRRGVRAADLPVGLAQDPPHRALPRRCAHPRPRACTPSG